MPPSIFTFKNLNFEIWNTCSKINTTIQYTYEIPYLSRKWSAANGLNYSRIPLAVEFYILIPKYKFIKNRIRKFQMYDKRENSLANVCMVRFYC